MTQLQHSLETASVEATRMVGEALGRSLVGGLTIGLTGPLGAGKTQLVKGIALGNALEDARQVTSPTFTLVHEYPGRFILYHVDVYRLREPGEVETLGLDERLRPDSVMVVEWAERVAAWLPTDRLWIKLEHLSQGSRRMTFKARGDPAVRCLARFRSECG